MSSVVEKNAFRTARSATDEMIAITVSMKVIVQVDKFPC